MRSTSLPFFIYTKMEELTRIPVYTVQMNTPGPTITSRPPANQNNNQNTNRNDWFEVIPGALDGVANIADVFWGQPDTYNTYNQEAESNSMTMIILVIVAVAALYFLLK